MLKFCFMYLSNNMKINMQWLFSKYFIHRETFMRPRNINWQDWKYTSFAIFIRHSQSMQWTNTNLMADVVENIGLKFRFLSLFSIHLYNAMNRNSLCRINDVNNKIQIDAKHQTQWWRNHILSQTDNLSI